MANPTVDSLAPGGVVQLDNPPAALDEATFDSLFPADGRSTVTPAAQPPAVTPGTPQPAAPAPAAQPTGPTTEPFIKGQRSVYNTAEAAIEGINQKDALIDQLRQRYALTTGIDPITGQPVSAVAQPQPQSYRDNPNQYIEDLYKAAKAGPQAYAEVQTKFMMDTLQPAMPLLQRAAREQAVAEVSKEIKEVGSYLGTPQYQKALDSNPELKQAIEIAESNFNLHSRLPGLYKIAYLTGQGLQLPEILKNQAAAPQTPPVQPRPTLQPSTQAPPQETTRPSFGNIEGIRSILRDSEARGLKLDF